MATDVGIKLAVDGEAQFKSALSAVNSQIKNLSSEMSASVTSMEGMASAEDLAGKKSDILSRQLDAQQQKYELLSGQYERAKSSLSDLGTALEEAVRLHGADSKEAEQAQAAYNRQADSVNRLGTQLNQTQADINKTQGAMNDMGSSAGDAAAAFDSGSESASVFGDVLKANLLSDAIKSGLSMLADAAKNLASSFKESITGLASYGDSIDKQSQKLGLSAEAYQEWDAILQHSGSSVSAMQAPMRNLTKLAEDNAASFEKLGLSTEEVAGMNQEQLFGAVVKQLQGMEQSTERTAIAQEFLGRSALELAPLLNTSAEDTEAMRQAVHDLGGVMSDEAVKSAAAFQDSLQDMNTAISGAKNQLTAEFLPSITEVMNGVAAIMSGDEGGVDMIADGIASFGEKLQTVLPKLLEVGGKIVGSVADGIGQNLPRLLSGAADMMRQFVAGIGERVPELLQSATSMVTELAAGFKDALPQMLELGASVIQTVAGALTENLPTLMESGVDAIVSLAEALCDPEQLGQMIDSALKLILALAEGLMRALPRLLEAAPRIITGIASALADNFSQILDKGVALIGELAAGIIQAIPNVAGVIPEVISALLSAFGDMQQKFRSIGSDLLTGIWNGISDKIAWLKGQVSGVVDRIKSWFTGKDGFDEHSPSKWSADVFDKVMQGAGRGLDTGLGSVMQSVGRAVESVKDGFSGLDLGLENALDLTGVAARGFAYRTPEPALAAAAAAPGTADALQPISVNVFSQVGGRTVAYEQRRYTEREQIRRGSSVTGRW